MLLRRVPAFSALPRAALDATAQRLRLENWPAGTDIVRVGEVGDRLYIIKSGAVDVLGQEGGREVALARLGTRDYFGEIALLRAVPRTATVRAHEAVELYSLARADFAELGRRFAAFDSAVRQTGEARYRDLQAWLLALR